MKKLTYLSPTVLLLVTLSMLVSCKKDDGVPIVLSTLSTTAVTNVTPTAATSGGKIKTNGGAKVTARGVAWSTTKKKPTTDDNKTTDGTGTGDFTSELKGLTAGTTYYVRAYVTNSAGTGYGNEIIFKTAKTVKTGGTVDIVKPVVSTTDASAVTQTVATSGGNVTSDGGAEVTARGVVWSHVANPTTAVTTKTIGKGTGVFKNQLTVLIPNITYYVRAYATNSAGTSYGSEITFKTKSAGTITLITQQQVVTFGSFKYTDVTENIRIKSGNTDPITDLSPLSTITSVGGLSISTNRLLKNLSGLSNISSVKGDLSIATNGALTDLSGLSSISSVKGYLRVSSNNTLKNLSGLSSISSVGGYLSISLNKVLTDVSGLSNIKTVGGDLNIVRNSKLINLCGIRPLLLTPKGLEGTYNVKTNSYNPTIEQAKDDTTCKE